MTGDVEDFVLGRNALTEAEVAGWDSGPLCECGGACDATLPKEAWLYSNIAGQCVTLPDHENPGERVVARDGYQIVEDCDE